MWDTGAVERGMRETGRWLLVAVSMVTFGVVAAVGLLPSWPATGVDLAADARAGGAGSTEAAPSYRLDGTAPATHPGTRAALGFLELDDPLRAAVDVLGVADAQAPDMNASTAYTWELPGGAELTAVAAGGPEATIVGLAATVPHGSGARLAMAHGVVIGEATPAGVVARWGPGADPPGEAGGAVPAPGTDYVLRYVTCRGPWPVIVKFDQPDGERSWTGAPVTSVLVAYADADPGSAGCPSAG